MTDESLALKYRPSSFADIVGQKVTAVVLDRMVASDRVPSGILFTGPRGSGKTSTARILAGSLNAEIIEVDAASHGLVDDVRQMIESLRYGGSRVVIYDEAHSMSREAFNAFLKVLEEPPAGTVFILVTTEPEKIPGTVKSRLMEFTFRKITPSEVLNRLKTVSVWEDLPQDDNLMEYIALRADGSMRDALMMLDQCWRAEILSKDEFLEMTGELDVAPDLVLAMLTGDHAHVFAVSEDLSQKVPDPSRLASMLAGVLKDVLVLKSGGDPGHKSEVRDKLKIIALHLESERIVAGLKMLWDLRTRVRSSNDPQGNLDLALILITDIFTQGRQLVPVQKEKLNIVAPRPEGSSRLTFAEL